MNAPEITDNFNGILSILIDPVNKKDIERILKIHALF